MNLDVFVLQLLNGLVLGMLLFMTAAGLSLILGLMDVVNLVHGSSYLLGAYVGLTIIRELNSFWLAAAVAPVLVGALGLLLERIFLHQLYERGHLHQVLFTFGAALVAADLMRWNWGSDVQAILPPAFLQGGVSILGSQFPRYRLSILIFGLLIAFALWLLLNRTRIGAVVRAGVADSQMVEGLGIDIRRVFALVFALGTALAALAGVLAGPILNVYPSLDFEILILAMVIVVIGGLGTLKGAFWGAMLVGMADTFGKAYLPQVSLFIIFVIMALVLLIKPSGLFGQGQIQIWRGSPTDSLRRLVASLGFRSSRRSAEKLHLRASLRAANDASVPNNEVNQDPKPRNANLGNKNLWNVRLLYLGLGALIAIFPFAFPSYLLSLAVEVLIFAIFAMSLDLLLGYTGLVSFGHAAFFGLGGYLLAFLARGVTGNLLATLPLVLLGTAFGAAIIGFFALRARGIYFLMLTLAFGQMLFGLAVKWTSVTGGSDGLSGIPRPHLGLGPLQFDFGSNIRFYYLVAIAFLATWWLLRRVVRSPFGHVLRGIKENEPRMKALGYNTWRQTMVAFVMGGAIAGLAGLLFAHFNWHASPESLYYVVSGQVMMMVIIGGSGTLLGPILGAGLVRLLPTYISTYLDRWQTVMGLVFIAFVLLAPQGIIGLIRARMSET